MNARTITGAAVLAVVTMLGVAVSPASAATTGDTALTAARTKLGAPYKYGGTGPKSWDCSGLTQWSYKQAGKTLLRTAQQQYNATKTKRIAPADRKPGDLVFIGSPGNIYHVGIYSGWRSGKGWMVNANTGSYRGRKVVDAPVSEYTPGAPRAYYGRP